jgi:DNA-binding FadR family transcriptional regulator
MFTHLQGQYLSFIDGYQRIHDRAPSEAEFQRYFAVTPPTVHQMILTLERKGVITRVPGKAKIDRAANPADADPAARSAPSHLGSEPGKLLRPRRISAIAGEL